MSYINISRESGDEGEGNKIVLEGDIKSLQEFHSRLGNVINNEIFKTSEVKFSDKEPIILLNGRSVVFAVRKTDRLYRKKLIIDKDVVIAAGIVILCITYDNISHFCIPQWRV